MKKIYIKPNTKTIILEAPLLMSGSDFDTTKVPVAGKDEEFNSRRQGGTSIWDTWK